MKSFGQPLTLPLWMRTFGRLLRVVGQVELTVTMLCMSIVTVLAVLQVGLRYFLNISIWWSQEASQIFIVASYFLGVSYVYKVRAYIVLDFLVDAFPFRFRLFLHLFAQLVTIGFCALVAREIWLLLPAQFNLRTNVLGLPKGLFALPVLLSAVSIAFTALYFFIACLWMARKFDSGSIDELETDLLFLQFHPTPEV